MVSIFRHSLYYALTNLSQKKKPLYGASSFFRFLWSRGESNPCPNIATIGFLHAYFTIFCRHFTGSEPTYKALS